MSTFVTTCKVQPLAFFDLAGILERIVAPGLPGSGETLDGDQKTLEVNNELDSVPCASQDELKHRIFVLMNTRSWRFTAPFRWVVSQLRNLTVDRGV